MSKPEDAKPHAPASFGRRSFLFASAGSGLAGAAAVAASGGLARPAATPEALTEPDGQGEGYRVTGHIQRYYRSTRL